MTRFALCLAVAAAITAIGCHGGRNAHPPTPEVAVQIEPIPATLEEVLSAERAGRNAAAEAGLLKLASADDPIVRRRAVVMLALLYQNESRFEEAGRLYSRAIAGDPLIAPFLLLRLGEVQEASGKPLDAIRTLESIAVTYPGSSVIDTVRLVLPRAYAAAADRAGAERATEDALRVRIDGLSEQALFETAESLDRSGFGDLASKLRARLLSAYPQGRFGEKVYRALMSMPPQSSPILTLGYDAALALAERLGRVNRYDEALDLLGSIAARFPWAAGDPNFVYIRTSSLFNSRNYAEVIQVEPRVDAPYYVAIQLLRARAYWRAGQNPQFLSILQDILSGYPDSREAVNARILLSKYYTVDEIDYPTAAAYLEQVIAAGQPGDDGENIWNLGWIYAQAGDETKALQTFDRYLAAYPDADYTSNALFWSGKLHNRAGRVDQRNAVFGRLIDFFPYSYYSYRAREILGLPLAAPDEVPGRDVFPASEVASGTGADQTLDRIHELMAVDLHEEAAAELQKIAGSAIQNKLIAFTLADLYAQAGQPLQANLVLQKNFRGIIRHGGSQVPPRFWEILYPRQYWNTILAAAEKSTVEPYLLAAIIRQESAWDPVTVSNAGAVGLMQIMPAEAARIAERGNLGFSVTREDLFDPEKNIAVGAAEIRQKLDAMNGRQVLAIAAYNAGEEAVGRWIAQTAIDDIDFFVESIPYSETKLYVKSVTRNLYEYRRIYGSP